MRIKYEGVNDNDFSCYCQVEVTFNFLEIRAMNTYPEHQVRTPSVHLAANNVVNGYQGKLFCLFPAGYHRYRQDYLHAETADAGAAGPHGRPHQLRPRPSLQQLHLCVSITDLLYFCLSVFVLCVLRSWPTLTALDSVSASWQLHFWAAFLFSSGAHSRFALVSIHSFL